MPTVLTWSGTRQTLHSMPTDLAEHVKSSVNMKDKPQKGVFVAVPGVRPTEAETGKVTQLRQGGESRCTERLQVNGP